VLSRALRLSLRGGRRRFSGLRRLPPRPSGARANVLTYKACVQIRQGGVKSTPTAKASVFAVGRFVQRQFDDKSRALADQTFDADAATVLLDNLLADAQP